MTWIGCADLQSDVCDVWWPGVEQGSRDQRVRGRQGRGCDAQDGKRWSSVFESHGRTCTETGAKCRVARGVGRQNQGAESMHAEGMALTRSKTHLLMRVEDLGCENGDKGWVRCGIHGVGCEMGHVSGYRVRRRRRLCSTVRPRRRK
eukprot:1802831-Rhodomonas_salina.1